MWCLSFPGLVFIYFWCHQAGLTGFRKGEETLLVCEMLKLSVNNVIALVARYAEMQAQSYSGISRPYAAQPYYVELPFIAL